MPAHWEMTRLDDIFFGRNTQKISMTKTATQADFILDFEGFGLPTEGW